MENKEIEIDELGVIVQYEYVKHNRNGNDEPEWEELNVKWIKNSQSLDYVEKNSFSNEEYQHIITCIFEQEYGNRQGKKRKSVPVSDADRILPGDSGTVYTGGDEESLNNSYPNEEG